MGHPRSNAGESRFASYIEGPVSVIGHADRAKPLRDYWVGLMMPCERKSVEPIAAVTAPDRTAAQHQSLLHFVGAGCWSDEEVCGYDEKTRIFSTSVGKSSFSTGPLVSVTSARFVSKGWPGSCKTSPTPSGANPGPP
jgi:hypothetical protein